MVCGVFSLKIWRNAPFQGSESSDFFVKFCPYQCQTIGDSITFLVKFFNAELIVACPIKQFRIRNHFTFKETQDSKIFFGLKYN